MKKPLSPAQLADIMARARALADEPFQDIDFAAHELGLTMDIDISTDFDFSALPSLPFTPSTSLERTPRSGRKKICIRVPHAVLQAFEDEAKRKGTGYQTLINRVLKEKSKGW